MDWACILVRIYMRMKAIGFGALKVNPVQLLLGCCSSILNSLQYIEQAEYCIVDTLLLYLCLLAV